MDANGEKHTSTLIPLQSSEFPRTNSSIFDNRVHPRECLDALGKFLYIIEAAQIQLPDFEHTGPLRAALDVLRSRLALLHATTGEDDLCSVETNVVACGFLSQTDVRPGNNDGFAGAVLGWVCWGDEELAIEEMRQYIEEEARDRHCDGSCETDDTDEACGCAGLVSCRDDV